MNRNLSQKEQCLENKIEIDWLIDSRYTDHIITSNKYFGNVIDLKKPAKVQVGDGRVLLATKMGNVVTHFPVHGEKNKNNSA